VSDWLIIYKSSNPNQSQIVKSVLEDNNIDVVVVDKMDSMHKHLMNADVELHIRPEDVIKAKYIISKNSL
jgi:hypothetical protein